MASSRGKGVGFFLSSGPRELYLGIPSEPSVKELATTKVLITAKTTPPHYSWACPDSERSAIALSGQIKFRIASSIWISDTQCIIFKYKYVLCNVGDMLILLKTELLIWNSNFTGAPRFSFANPCNTTHKQMAHPTPEASDDVTSTEKRAPDHEELWNHGIPASEVTSLRNLPPFSFHQSNPLHVSLPSSYPITLDHFPTGRWTTWLNLGVPG